MNLEIIEEKWGKLIHEEHYKWNCAMSFISDAAKLNVIFDSEDVYVIERALEEKLNAKLLPELKQFYLSHNGCRLFFSSFNIFGVQCHRQDIYEPFDIVQENLNNYAKMKWWERKQCKLLFFGSLSGDYIFGYDKEEMSRIYCVKAGSSKSIYSFDSFQEFWNYIFERLLDEYDKDGHKKHPVKEFAGIPALENVTNDFNSL